MRTWKVGDLCSRARIDNHGRNEGCIGRLVITRVKRIGQGRYVADPNGEIEVLTCPRCGGAHGIPRAEEATL